MQNGYALPTNYMAVRELSGRLERRQDMTDEVEARRGAERKLRS